MKESELFLGFAKRNLWMLVLPSLLGCFLSIFFYSKQSLQTKFTQSFKFEYSLENFERALALTDQSVAELRLQSFDSNFPGSKAAIYKPAPLTVSIDITAGDKNSGFELLLKETEYLRKNFTVSALGEPKISFIEPSLFKYLLTGALIGFLTGLIISLVREYLKNY